MAKEKEKKYEDVDLTKYMPEETVLQIPANSKAEKYINDRIAMEIVATTTDKEVDNLNKRKVPKFVLERRSKDLVDKMKTPLWKFEEMFINEQKARRNSEYTIKHYQRTFKKLYEFLAYYTCEDTEDIDLMYDNAPESEKNPYVYYGKLLPMASLEIDNFQMEFGNWLEDSFDANEQTVLSYLRDYKAIMYYGMDNGWITPFSIKIKTIQPDIKNCYTKAEIARLLVKPDIDDFTQYRNWVIVNYLLATGNRVQTIINLKVKDVDLQDGYININTQKSGKTTRIGLEKKIVRILKEYINEYRCSEDDGLPLLEEYLFCNRFGEKLTDNGLKSAIKSYNLHRDVHKTSTHLFRHTFAKEWIISGGDIASLQKMLGQTSLAVVNYYANLYSSDVKKKAEEHSILANTRTASGTTLKRKGIQRRKS